MKNYQNLIYLVLAISMLVYAVPQLEINSQLTKSTIFALVWLSIALLVIAANLHVILGVTKETKSRLASVKRMRAWQTEQRWSRILEKLPMK